MGTVEQDTARYNNEQADLERIYEGIQKEVSEMSDRDIVEYMTEKLSDEFYDFIMEDLRLTYCKMQGIPANFMPTKLGGIPNLLIELFQPENYLMYFWDLVPEQQEEVRKMVLSDMYDRAACEYELDKEF